MALEDLVLLDLLAREAYRVYQDPPVVPVDPAREDNQGHLDNQALRENLDRQVHERNVLI